MFLEFGDVTAMLHVTGDPTATCPVFCRLLPSPRVLSTCSAGRRWAASWPSTLPAVWAWRSASTGPAGCQVSVTENRIQNTEYIIQNTESVLSMNNIEVCLSAAHTFYKLHLKQQRDTHIDTYMYKKTINSPANQWTRCTHKIQPAHVNNNTCPPTAHPHTHIHA